MHGTKKWFPQYCSSNLKYREYGGRFNQIYFTDFICVFETRKMRTARRRQLPEETRPSSKSNDWDRQHNPHICLTNGANQCWARRQSGGKKQPHVADKLQTVITRSRQWGCPSRNWFAFVNGVLNCIFKLQNEKKCLIFNVWNCLCCDLQRAQPETAWVRTCLSHRGMWTHTRLLKWDLSHVSQAEKPTAATPVHYHLFSLLFDLLFW